MEFMIYMADALPLEKKTAKFVENSIKTGQYWINASKENVHSYRRAAII